MRLIMKDGQETRVVFGKVVRAGEEFDVPDNEAVTWIKLGFARQAPARRGRYSRSDMRAEDE
jgi:hypothetical protein